jgi:hypothetical protein
MSRADGIRLLGMSSLPRGGRANQDNGAGRRWGPVRQLVVSLRWVKVGRGHTVPVIQRMDRPVVRR